jgi:hypothetical protein
MRFASFPVISFGCFSGTVSNRLAEVGDSKLSVFLKPEPISVRDRAGDDAVDTMEARVF